MQRSLFWILACALLAARAPGAQQESRPGAASSLAPVEVLVPEDARVLLRHEDPRLVAWGAHHLTGQGHREFLPDMLATLRRLPQLPVDPRRAVCGAALLGALISLDAEVKISERDLRLTWELDPHLRLLTLILAARDPAACQQFLFAARAGAQTHAEWLACTNLLLEGAPASLAPQLVREVRLRLWHVPRWDVARAPAVREPEDITAWGSPLEVPPGFPPLRAIVAIDGPRPRWPCLAAGPEEVAWLRHPDTSYAGHHVTAWPRKSGQELDRDDYRLRCLAQLAGHEFDALELRGLNCLDDQVLDAGPEAAVQRERERIGRQWQKLIDGLVAKGLFRPDPRDDLRTPVVVESVLPDSEDLTRWAWDAYLAGERRQVELVPQVRVKLRLLSQCPADEVRAACAGVLLDALIRLEARASSADLRAAVLLDPRLRLLALLVALRDPGACREFVQETRAAAQDDGEWLTATNLLLPQGGKALAETLLRELRLRLVVTVRDGELPASALSAPVAARPSLIALPGLFPKAGSYAAYAGAHSGQPAEAVASLPGPEQVFFVRTKGEVGAGDGEIRTRRGEPLDHDDYRVRCLLHLAGHAPEQLELRGTTSVDHVWRDARHYQEQVERAQEALRARARQLRELLRAGGLVAPEPPDLSRPPIVVEAIDRRRDQSVPLPRR